MFCSIQILNIFVGGYDFEADTSYTNWTIDNGMMTFYPDVWGCFDKTLDAGFIYTLNIRATADATTDQTLYLSANASLPGTMENPAELVVGGENVGSFGEWEGYFFTWTATEAGKLTVSVDTEKSTPWAFFMMGELANGESFYSDTHYVSSDPLITSETVNVEAGDVYLVCVSGDEFIGGTVYVNASFVAGEAGGEEGGEEGGESGGNVGGDVEGEVIASGTDVLVLSGWVSNRDTNYECLEFLYTPATDGIITVNMGAADPGWQFAFINADGSTTLPTKGKEAASEQFEVLAGNTYGVQIWAYDKAGWSETDGCVSYEIIFTSSEVDIEVQKEDYIVSDTILDLGENYLTMADNAITTIFEFRPSENGIYTFTVSDSAALIGYWGATSGYVADYTENKTNVLVYTMDKGVWKLIEPMDDWGNVIVDECYEEWACPSIMVGISGIEGEFTLTIEKTGDAEKEEEIVYDEYINVHFPSEDNLVDTTGEQVNNVDITKPQTVVKDENGFYHLGSVDGPMLYVNLISDGFDITGPYYSGMGAITLRGQYIDDEGNVYNYDFLSAMRAYANVAYMCENEDVLYPLTEDLMIFWKAYGTYQGWFNADMSSFEAIDGTQNADSAWLVSCVYLGDPIVDETPDEGGEENPGSGDYSVAGLVVAMMAATAGAVVISKKKEF